MWTGQIARTERNGDTLDIIVTYSDGNGNEFSQVISTDSAQSDTWLSDQINAKLTQLNSLDLFEQSVNALPIMNSTITVAPTPQPVTITPLPINTNK